MIFDRNEKKQVVALLGAGSMGTAIVRRIAAGKKVLLGDISERALERVSDDFRRSGYDVETQVVNALEKESIEAFAKRAAALGPVMYFIDTAGASPNQASPEHIVNLDMVSTKLAVHTKPSSKPSWRANAFSCVSVAGFIILFNLQNYKNSVKNPPIN